jgi:hypothetical protein
MKERRIVIFGFDDDEREMEFQWINVEPQVDVGFALEEALKKFPRKSKAAVQASDLNGCQTYFMVYAVPSRLNSGTDIYAEYMDSDYDRIRSNVVAEGGGWIVNFNTEETEYVLIRNWKNRDQAENTQEAMEHISTYMAQNFGSLPMNLKEIEEYAAKFNIPFSADLMSQFRSDFDVYQSQWDASSAYC